MSGENGHSTDMESQINELLPFVAKFAWEIDNIPGLPHAEIVKECGSLAHIHPL